MGYPKRALAGASYKLNLRNYGSNYVGIKAITGASSATGVYLARLTSTYPLPARGRNERNVKRATIPSVRRVSPRLTM